MNGDSGVKKAANKVKQVAASAGAATAAAANGNKKRRKDLKPIITGEAQTGTSQGSASSSKRCVPSFNEETYTRLVVCGPH